jgi:hypothetical protein
MMIKRCIIDLKFFAGFFIFWMAYMAVITRLMSATYDKKDYQELDNSSIYMIQIYRNSVGNIALP